MARRNVLIIGAAGRDFHNFNTFFRDNPDYRVVAFTATQIPDIDGRKYPPELAGANLYPDGIPVYEQNDLAKLIRELEVQDCFFSYSDVSYDKVMSLASVVQAAGANFMLLGPGETMLRSTKPLISVTATRTGCGKSQTSRKVVELLTQMGLKVVAIRHPMPYGDLNAQKVQRFAEIADLKKHKCTIEEMEEYEPHIVRGNVIYAGVDYEAILGAAENDPNGCDVILWDGGNNDMSFYHSDLSIVVADPHRAGAEGAYYPSEVNVRLADVVIINKIDTSAPEKIQAVRDNIARINPKAVIVEGASPVRVEDPELIRGKRILAVEDGPTLTHGEMKIGAAIVAAQKLGASEIVDPRPWLAGKLEETFRIYPNIGTLLPAMGYGDEQVKDLEKTINKVDCDAVIVGTPIDLRRVVKIKKPSTRVYYDLEEIGEPKLTGILDEFVKKHLPGRV
ncbi:cyclic 2,3-diphosphoglycerate synthase [Prolixibacter sp. NT017]|uniref:cyclic 2,3-diphosphoglycerate synthase n=1 Tax=Prolixibacter sp. NT017 TaxID=2652390 RepID=UPI00126BB2B8|nr:cyclic 2,3-diphosphoglycerate synthase [Prolixibacter sp. NT017]GET27663.1 GTPase [Prolixibacter sp. NT017]